MGKIEHFRLPFGAASDELIYRLIDEHYPEDIYQSEISLIADSEGRTSELRNTITQRLGILPEGFFGTIDGFVRSLAPLAGLATPSALSLDLLIEKELTQHSATPPSRGTVNQMRQALRRVRVALEPQERDHQLRVLESKVDETLARRIALVRATLFGMDQHLNALGVCDEADLEWKIVQRLKQSASDIGLLIIDDIYRLGPSQRHLLKHLLPRLPKVVLITRSSTTDSPAEALLKESRRFFESCAPSIKLESPHPNADILSAYLTETPGSCPETLKLASFHSERAQLQYVAGRIKELHLNENVALERIGLACVTPSQEQEASRLLSDLGIPHHSSTATSLIHSPPVAALLNLIDTTVYGFERQSLINALRSPYLHGLAKVCGLKPNAWQDFVNQLDVAARKLRIVGGVASPESDKAWLTPFEEGASPFASLREPVKKLFQSLHPLTQAASLTDFLARIESLLKDLHVYDVLHNDLGSPQRETLEHSQARFNHESYQRFALVFAELQTASRLLDHSGTVDGRIHLLRLREALSLAQVTHTHSEHALSVLGLLDARSRSFDYLFVCGLVDGELPFPDPENVYLPHRLESLAAQALRSDEAQALARDVDPAQLYEHLFACCLANGNKELILSMPLQVDDAEAAPSQPLHRLMECVGLSELELEAPPSQPLSNAQLQDRLARNPQLSHDKHRPSWLEPALVGISTNLQRDSFALTSSSVEGSLDMEARAVNNRALHKYGDPHFSPSALELYAACPMRFFFRYVLDVPEPDEPDYDISPSERGTLLHETLEAFCLEIRNALSGDASALSLPLETQNKGTLEIPLVDIQRYEKLTKKSAQALLRSVFERSASNYHVDSAHWRRWVERTLKSLEPESNFRSELSNFLVNERSHQAVGIYPWLMEHEFGRHEDALSPAFPLELERGTTLALRGSIDRVDVVVHDGKPAMLLVRDYKSGSTKLGARVKSGTAFQLPLYQTVAMSLARDLEIGGFFYHKLGNLTQLELDAAHLDPSIAEKIHGKPQRSSRKPSPKQLTTETFPRQMNMLVEALESGKFHPTLIDGEKSCAFCAYRGACNVRLDKQLALEQRGETLRNDDNVYYPKEDS